MWIYGVWCVMTDEQEWKEYKPYYRRGNVKIDIELTDKNAKKPEYQHVGEDVGMDLYSIEEKEIIPTDWKLIDTGVKVAIPEGYGAFVYPRSGLALKRGVTILNADGVIDPGYRGTIGVILINHGLEEVHVLKGDRIAQLIIHKCPQVEWNEVESLGETDRNKGGFGHSGK